MNKYISLAAVAAAALALGVSGASALTASGNLTVDLTVSSHCSVGTSALHFGNVDAGATVEQSGGISVTCTNGTGYDITLDNGGHPVSGARNVSNGTDLIPYTLCGDAFASGICATPWAGATAKHGVGTGATATVDVYGQAVAGANVTTGLYQDSVGITLTYN
jgi:spore coat protein U-like protein